jgi:hypothetical protein
VNRTYSELDALTDAQLQQLETRVITTSKKAVAFVPGFPLSILYAVVSAGAEKALPVVLAIHRQLRMTGREWTPLNSAVWKAAGSPSDKERASILRKLKGLPDLIRVTPHRTATTHYWVARGSLWQRGP